MPRRFDYDTDEERLPEGMVRVGYDADTEVYTFRDTDGSLWEGPPGCRYGRLTKVANPPKPPSDLTNIDVDGTSYAAKHWRAELMPLLNFFMILALFLVGLFWFLGWMTSSKATLSRCGPGSHAHQIQQGESCWDIAKMHGIDVPKLKEANGNINCDLLEVGGVVCVPAMPKI
ncbi:hypothetical protein M406DRAFT_52969 [Cryphonectria parasitica EP155]|uniref:LysM domain-containing protein n=1 Tax=Cryphonectria parasitica (strain ATCC 38755 / EP155) TaxID=660469 RepID=A0A9P4XSC6_CRYP1|nr:uncharacterized protein M406DRAFT_52969 [Cryphonectria parasitica EP155]KAF3760327.1 hypothetical protein M406DRAFT_52969 [Cryphonectria parasitica EP155]